MLDRLHQSLALRLAVQYALVFAFGAAVLFGVLYWLLADALDARERAALVRQTEEYAAAFERGGGAGVIARVSNDASPDIRALFVRLMNPAGAAVYEKWPEEWIETQVKNTPIGGGFTVGKGVTWVRVTRATEAPLTTCSAR